MSSLNDPAAVREEYADESRFSVRAGSWERSTGPNAVTMCREAIAEVAPQSVLEVGPGRGETAEWVARELGSDVVAIDQSERMVELTRARGIDARLGDVQELPFADESFDCVVAAWMLYHVPDVDRALGEIARVLKPGGRLVAVTNSNQHIQELRPNVPAFHADEAEERLGRHFASVERRDAYGEVVWTAEEAREYVLASRAMFDHTGDFDGPVRVTKAPVVFVATR